MGKYVLSCCSTADLSKEHFDSRNIKYVCFHFTLDGKQYDDDLGKSVPFDVFYRAMANGAETHTSQINVDEYVKYFEAMDPTTAEYLYKQVVIQGQKDKELEQYAAAYSSMKPKAAAAIFETMQDDLELVAKILEIMGTENRGAILGVMNPEVAAKITKIMDPDS